MKNNIQSLVKIVWEMNLDTFRDEFTYKKSYGIKNYVWDPNADVENENFLTDFSWQILAKNTKISLSSESVKIKEQK